MSNSFGMNRDVIKYIAMVTMFLNHLSYVLYGPAGGLTALILRDIGYFTAPVMCYFMVEGFRYTRSKKKYALRLAVFALISQGPFYYLFAVQVGQKHVGMNMIFTLLICFGVLMANDYILDLRNRYLVIAGMVLLSLCSDWAVMAPLLTLLIYWVDDQEQIRKIYFIAAISYGAGVMAGDYGIYPVLLCIADGFGSSLAVMAAGYTVLRLYNGKRARRGRTFHKWFFYWFYPVHLLVLTLVAEI